MAGVLQAIELSSKGLTVQRRKMNVVAENAPMGSSFAPSGQVVYQDDFSDPDSGWWVEEYD